jgi:hypothetical protein
MARFAKIAEIFCYQLRRGCVCPSTRVKRSHWTGLFMKFYILGFFPRKSVVKIQVSLKSDRNSRYFKHAELTCIISRWIRRMKNVSDRICTENQNAHFIFSDFFFPRKSFRLWDNMEGGGRRARETRVIGTRPSPPPHPQLHRITESRLLSKSERTRLKCGGTVLKCISDDVTYSSFYSRKMQ